MNTVYILRRIEKNGFSYLSSKTFNFIMQKINMASTFEVSDIMEFDSEKDAENFLNLHGTFHGLIEIVKVIKR